MIFELPFFYKSETITKILKSKSYYYYYFKS